MIIGIIGLSRRDFTNFCKTNECIRVTETEYRDLQNNRYILVDRYLNACGRIFDRIIDLDPVRWDLIHRVTSKKNYHIGLAPLEDSTKVKQTESNWL